MSWRRGWDKKGENVRFLHTADLHLGPYGRAPVGSLDRRLDSGQADGDPVGIRIVADVEVHPSL